jgi:hypothetical protein
MDTKSYRQEIWKNALLEARKKYDTRTDIKRTILGILLLLLVVIVVVIYGLWDKNQSIPLYIWGIFGANILTICATPFLVYIDAYFNMWNIAAQRDHDQRKLIEASNAEPIPNAIAIEIDNDYKDNDGRQIVSIKVKNQKNEELICYASAKSIIKWIEAGREKNEDLNILMHAGSLFSWSGGSNQGQKTILPNLVERINIAQGEERKMMFLLQNNMEYFEQYANATFILEIEIGGRLNNKRIEPVLFVGNLEFHKAEHFSFLPQQEDRWTGSDTDENINIDLSQYKQYDDISYRLLVLKQGDPRKTIEKEQ